MCDIDEMYVEDEECEINDDLLIELVKANSFLYNKADKNFKNTEMKKDRWTAISAGCGAPSGEAAERRWSTLRNMLGRKMREMKEKGPSGSKGGRKVTPWPLLGAMSFILPYMENRMKTGSVLSPEPRSASQSPIPTGSDSSLARATPSPTLSNAWDTSSTLFSPVGSDRDDLSPDEPETSECLIPSLPVAKKKASIIVPKPDPFANKKSEKMVKIEAIMQQSSEAMRVMAESFKAPDQPSQAAQREHPYMTALQKAFAEVPANKEFDCFLQLMNVIQSFK